jgi:1,4-alpha-glucan branching enzyme
VRVATLRGALEAGCLGAPVELPPSSWGSGKDWRVWDGAAVADLVAANGELQRRLLSIVDDHAVGRVARDPVLDQLVTEAMLALSSDWAFMVSKGSAEDYARRRASVHSGRFHQLADLLVSGDREKASTLAAAFADEDAPFGHLDARALTRADDRGRGAQPAQP